MRIEQYIGLNKLNRPKCQCWWCDRTDVTAGWFQRRVRSLSSCASVLITVDSLIRRSTSRSSALAIASSCTAAESVLSQLWTGTRGRPTCAALT